jgi:hypothetical protein
MNTRNIKFINKKNIFKPMYLIFLIHKIPIIKFDNFIKIKHITKIPLIKN